MTILTTVAGYKARHIFLCEEMRRRFEANYGARTDALVSSNGRHLPAPLRARTRFYRGDRPLRIGLLSNLCAEKGLNDFLEILRESKDVNFDLVGVLAGPPVSNADAAAIKRAVASLEGRLQYLGPVYGKDKLAFFDGVDVLVFPTRYRCEAYPLVVLEALASAVPVIAYGRGCIPSLLEEPAGFVISPDNRFSAEALTILKRWRDDPDAWQAAADVASRLSQRLEAESEEHFKTLVEALTGNGPNLINLAEQ